MNRFFCSPLPLAALVFLFFSCAREVTENADDVEKRILEAHIEVEYNNSIQPTSSGLYIISKTEGSGQAVTDTSGVFVKYSTMSLQKNYLSTSYESIAKIVGLYTDTTYYGPVLFTMGDYTLTRGIEEALLGLKEGATVKFIQPSWLSDYNYDGSSREASGPIVYEIKVLKVINDLEKFQYDTLEAFSNKYFGGLDSLQKGYYFKSLSEGIGDTLESGEEISYWYVGRLLDGFVFDTNIEDTARKYNIYNSSNTYSALTFSVVDSASVTGSSLSVISGIAKTFLQMKHGGKAVTFFSSGWGYGSTSMSFGRYQPLFFYIEVVTDDDDDVDDDE
jgi:FKBP-type peptidyl-prolyl cis-trans isomerase